MTRETEKALGVWANEGGETPVTAPAVQLITVIEEVDALAYTFENEAALAAWSNDAMPTYVSVRPATAEEMSAVAAAS
jgi:hypothetical protein